MSHRPAAESLDLLAAFERQHGRLPKSTATDPEEKRLAGFMLVTLRQQFRLGTLAPALRERAGLIPGALDFEPREDQDDLLEELAAFVAEHGHRPRHPGKKVPARELTLRYWVNNHAAGDSAAKGPRQRARHEAIEAILAPAPSYAAKRFNDRLAAAEQFVEDYGHRPPVKETVWLSHYLKGEFDLDAAGGPRSRRDVFTAPRLRAVLEAPSSLEYRWDTSFEDLTRFAEVHGALPVRREQGPLYTWLTVQRREYKAGRLPADRADKLIDLGAIRIPAPARLAA
jgi:hypothetical protein